MAEAARDFISIATQLYSKGSYSKSVDLFILAFEKNPELKALFEPEFRAALNRYNEALYYSGRMQHIFQNFGRAMKVFPDNIHLMNDTGKYLYKFMYYEEAWCHFQKALEMDSGFVNAEKNLNSIKNLLVERWHYRMLNDKIRNEAYREAIKETLIPFKDTVLDLGSGTGLFTLYSAECKPLAVTAVDSSEQMAKMTGCVLDDYGLEDVVVVHKKSTAMDHTDIGGKQSLIVTEMFDAGLFGEHVLDAVRLAHDHLLAPGGTIIPNKADFFVVGAKSDQLNLRYKLSKDAKTLLNISQNMNVHKSTKIQYDCEDVQMFKDLKYMTLPIQVLEVDFNNYEDVLSKLHNDEPYQIDLEAVQDGEIDVLIGYFNLYLSDTVSITTDPLSDRKATAWQQCIFFDYLPHPVAEDEMFDVGFTLCSDELRLASKTHPLIRRISTSVIRFLNDSEYVNMITRCLGMASVYLGQMADMSEVKIVDLCPFPLFGLMMLKRGAKSLICYAQRAMDERFFKTVFHANDIPLPRVTILVGEDWTQASFGHEKFHAVFCNYLDMCGDIDLRLFEVSQHLKNANLLPGGLFMPANVTLMGQVVSSRWLDVNNRVYNANVSNYEIAKYINKYQVSQNFHVYLTRIDYTPLTDPVILGKYGHVVSGVENIPVIISGFANGILCWYNIEMMDDLGEISTKRDNAFIDGMAFLANPAIEMLSGGIANVLRCIDVDGAFKLVLDVEAT